MDESRQELIQKALAVAERLGKRTFSRSEFARETGISLNQVYQHFDGWRDLCQAAGLEPHTQNMRLSDDEIFAAMRDAFLELGTVTTRAKFNRAFHFSVDVFKKRGMTWTAALVAVRRWCEENEPTFPLLDQLPTANPTVIPRLGGTKSILAPTWQAKAGNLYGEFLNFRGLQHAPVNEQGVVFLFGMIAHELGYAVEIVQTGFPDCEAKRRVAHGRWERVRIEFEFTSRSFRDHGHDTQGCEVLICWEHNWPDCPVEVLELREAIKRLPSSI